MRITWYRTARGDAPVEEYLDALDAKLRSKTLRSLALLKEYGMKLREPESKHLQRGIYELRSSFGSETGRVLYFFMQGDTAVVTHGFKKKTRKTPRKEIARALSMRADYLERAEGCEDGAKR